MPTSAGLFDSSQAAERAAAELERRGFPKEAIRSVAQEGRRSAVPAFRGILPSEHAVIVRRTGGVAVVGAVLGGAVGWMAGLSTFTLPGLGPVIPESAIGTILGPLAAGAGLGAFAGAVVGALYGMGVAEDASAVYVEGVIEGKVLLSVETDEARLAEADEVLRAAGAQGVGEDRARASETLRPGEDPATIIGDYPPDDTRGR